MDLGKWKCLGGVRVRRAFYITVAGILFLAAGAAAQDSAPLNTLTGPFRQPSGLVSATTLNDSILVLRQLVFTTSGGDSAYAAQLLAAFETRFEADSLGRDEQLAAKTDTTRFKADSALYAKHFALDGDSVRIDSALHVRDIYMGGSGGVAGNVTVANHIYFDVLVPANHTANMSVTKFYADSTLEAAKYLYRVASDTTSPGLFYTLSAAGWVRADTSVNTTALVVCVDSVNKGEVCRFQTAGAFTLARWQGLWAPGTKLVSDSLTAGQIDVTNANRTNALKMQRYAVSDDSATGRVILTIDPNVWYYEP